jgi:hypothetical protein
LRVVSVPSSLPLAFVFGISISVTEPFVNRVHFCFTPQPLVRYRQPHRLPPSDPSSQTRFLFLHHFFIYYFCMSIIINYFCFFFFINLSFFFLFLHFNWRFQFLEVACWWFIVWCDWWLRILDEQVFFNQLFLLQWSYRGGVVSDTRLIGEDCFFLYQFLQYFGSCFRFLYILM